MKKIINRINSILANAGINVSASVVIALISCGIIAAALSYLYPLWIAPVGIAICIAYTITTGNQPSLDEIAQSAIDFLDEAVPSMYKHLSVLQSLYYDEMPVDDGSKRRFFRWQYNTIVRNGVPIVCIGLLRTGKVSLSAETLKQERTQLQTLLTDDLKRGLIPIAAHPTYSDGTPTLSLLKIEEVGNYTVFSFVWVNSQKTSDFVHLHDIPPTSDNADDGDF